MVLLFSVPPQMLKPMQLQKQTFMKPSYQAVVAKKPADYVHVGQWSSQVDEHAWSLGKYNLISLYTQYTKDCE